MNWINCISNERLGVNNSSSSRTQYQRDYDRIIFSSAFRRLQNKTQVFPLPGNTFVHSRLTHSLEVASVGRSLGNLIGEYISTNNNLPENIKEFYKYDLSSVISAGCLAHDLGNPPFGHSGEDAISNYFRNNASLNIEGGDLRSFYDNHEWLDLINFEGNANALHILTNKYSGKIQGSFSLTLSTLASVLKYPCSSLAVDKNFVHRKKYGYLKKDAPVIKTIAESTNMILDTNSKFESTFKRHPFVYIVEAADDICYRIIDLEDAHRIKILPTNEVVHILLKIINDLSEDKQSYSKTTSTLNNIKDSNEKISYLRAKTINILVQHSFQLFTENSKDILSGNWNNSLLDTIENQSNGLKYANTISIEKIYNHPSVIQIEIAGYNILYELLNTFLPIVLKEKLTSLEKKIKLLIPNQFIYDDNSLYLKTLGIVDFISGMTDGYATEYYRKSKGIIIDNHK